MLAFITVIGNREHDKDVDSVMKVFIFKYALILQSDSQNGVVIKTYIARLISLPCVLCVLCHVPSLLEDKNVITRALVEIRKIDFFDQKVMMFLTEKDIYEWESKCVESVFNYWFKPVEAWFFIIYLDFVSVNYQEPGLVGIKPLVENLFTTH